MLISAALDSRKNNFDYLRLVAAIAVIVSHTFSVVGMQEPATPFFLTTYGGLGVDVFMMISGFLVTKSWFKTENIFIFLKARFLRIFPALFVMIFLTVFVMGPIVTSIQLNEYFKNVDTYKYFLSDSVFYIRYSLPGVFTDNPLKFTVNGSIWTLRFEFALYFVLAFLGITGLLKRKFVSLLVFSVLLTLTVIANTIQLNHLIYLPCYFMVGVVFYLYKDSIPLKGSYACICLLVFIISSFIGGLNGPMFIIFGSYLMFYIALTPSIQLPHLTKIGDFSYGLYIYAFPVQQMVAWFYKGRLGYAQDLVFTLIFTGILAFLSWHLIERRALNLKNRPLFQHQNRNEAATV